MLGDEAFVEVVRRAVGRRPVRVRSVVPAGSGGNTAARRAVVELRDGATAFVKMASDPATRAWLHAEHRVYSSLRAPFLPSMRGWYADDRIAVLALDDLSGARWPPPWADGDVTAVTEALDALHAAPPPGGMPGLRERFDGVAGWEAVERAPTPLVSTGLCSAGWLERALKTLKDAASEATLDGDVLVHLDVRSDNLCIRPGGQAVLVDWSWASVGNPDVDTVWWLPSLHAEGGPPPWELCPHAPPELVSWVAGYLAAHATRPRLGDAPDVARMQRDQLRSALPWAARVTGIAAPDRP